MKKLSLFGGLVIGLAFFANSSSAAGLGTTEVDLLTPLELKAELISTRAALDDCHERPRPCAARTECSACIPLSNWLAKTCHVYDCDGHETNKYTEYCN